MLRLGIFLRKLTRYQSCLARLEIMVYTTSSFNLPLASCGHQAIGENIPDQAAYMQIHLAAQIASQQVLQHSQTYPRHIEILAMYVSFAHKHGQPY
jgi:hypothetical protein